MGQLFCKDCGEGRLKKSALVSWDGEQDRSWHSDDHDTDTTGITSSLRSRASSGNLDPRRSNRIKHKKRSVALHAEFRDRQGILAPPLVTERLMEDTDNVFSGQDLGVDSFRNGSTSSSLFDKIPQDSSFYQSGRSESNSVIIAAADEAKRHVKFEKTPEEYAFLDRALSDDDNFVFDGLSTRMRQKLKDSMQRVVVPKDTLLIKKGDDPDYLYLILEGEIAVYIDPNEYIDENAVEIGKHALIDITLKAKSSKPSISGLGEPITREFKQSYVLELRKSLFQSSYDETNGVRKKDDNIVGKVLSVVRESFSGQDSRASQLSGILEETQSMASDEDAAPPFTLLNELRGLKHERDLGTGDVFGELGLLYNCPRTASCLTTTNCIFYRVDGDMFRSILSSSNADRVKKRYTESKAAIEALFNIGVFSSEDEKALRDMGSVLNPVTFDQEDLVITKGAYDNMMFFVMAGKLLAHDIGTGDSRQADMELGEGGHFGELNLLTGRPSIANVTVLTPKARLMAVTKKDYMKRRESLEPLMKKLWLRNALLTIPAIAKSKLLQHEINCLVLKLESVSFPTGNISFTDKMKSALFIVVTGKIQMSELTDGDGVVNTFHQQDHFGGRSLFDDKFFERKIQVRAILPSECMMLTRCAIVDVIGRINRLGKPMLPVSRKLIKNMKKSDLILHRIIGVGNFGRVWLVQHKISSAVYALKVMDKKEIIQRKMTKGVTREKNVMASVEHPFISNLVSTFHDKQSLYMLMSYVQGGELFGLIYNISKKGYLSNDAAAFYGACLVEALCHLHSRNICHRDIKPENILINAAGYVVLIDFGFAKVVLDKTFTMCGSPEYMAPEILLGKGHSLSVDHWALGVVLYEMLVGQTPFIHVGATRVTLFRRICNGSFAFPNTSKHGIAVNDNAKLFIRGLLNKKCGERIGSSLKNGDEEIRQNAWFQGLLTEYKNAFLSQKVAPPWLPDIDSELDTSYFGSHDNVEKEVMATKKEVLDNQCQSLFEDFGLESSR
eukprot:CAMPEP_0172528038 /NCGR_PEP_ID=MMETSP1067-20121228/2560_1 /TAXON_ID=265564 ORGANISM="Thalassiosira punctigera, Strain Tpunct2005C2" /NCGR_SAMPLE_ID=MMETSP1067 /ASSEMBLY_ACC=CAM_ASM_000444 /LENGTH=1011 /DNA_ID=CAMNT_0013311891 /DNA_START=142 /DNA_END=3177 /DNA_ORIENTATION=-